MCVTDEIEESLRICEEILNENPKFVSEMPEMDVSDIPVLSVDEPVKEETKAPEEPQQKWEEKLVAEEQERPLVFEPAEEQQFNPRIDHEDEEQEEGSWKGFLVRLACCVLVAFVVAVLITQFVANRTTVEGNSMNPCLRNGDELILEKISYLMGEPERFDVIVFEQSEQVNYIKRVIGLPGETVQIRNDKIYINNEAIYDEFQKEPMNNAGLAKDKITLGPDEYFVLGDNRNASKDSRDQTVGMVKRRQIQGKAWIRLLPLSDLSLIE